MFVVKLCGLIVLVLFLRVSSRALPFFRNCAASCESTELIAATLLTRVKTVNKKLNNGCLLSEDLSEMLHVADCSAEVVSDAACGRLHVSVMLHV